MTQKKRLIDDPAVAAAIEKKVAEAPPLSREQVDRLQVLLAPIRNELAARRKAHQRTDSRADAA